MYLKLNEPELHEPGLFSQSLEIEDSGEVNTSVEIS